MKVGLQILSLVLKPRLSVLLVLCSIISGSGPADVSSARIKFLLRDIARIKTLAGGRLTAMPYSIPQSDTAVGGADWDAILSSQNSDTVSHRRILTLVYIIEGNLDRAEAELRQLALELPND